LGKGLRKFLKEFKKARILVVGDLMLDHFIWGNVTRISPEAPVPVVNVTSETHLLGGAANVYHNILTLGGRVKVCGVTGQDESGKNLLSIIQNQGGSTEGIVQLPGYPTIQKTRIIAHSQQVVRFDHEKSDSFSQSTIDALLLTVERELKQTDCLVLSDYAKGVINPLFMEGLHQLLQQYPIKVVVDPKVSHMFLFRNTTIITPNHLEASQAAGIELKGTEDLIKAGQSLLDRLKCQAVLITRGDRGMSLFEPGGKINHIPTVAKEVYDVTGAGDTVVSVLALSLAAGASFTEAALLSNYAASIVVGTVGTATVKPEQLDQILQQSEEN
jgi:D-beta-D-heptose 7-phosphate kinase/D-beta-D-heptose 1-phosphate adenosyltransferase